MSTSEATTSQADTDAPSPTTDLTGRTALITGASSGIGRQIALAFAANGAAVVVTDIDEDPRDADRPTAHEIAERYDGEAVFVEHDVAALDQAQQAVGAAEQFGGVDIVVNNAGIFRSTPFVDVTPEDFDTLMNINVRGLYFTTQAAVRSMLDDGRPGSIINMSSVAGIQGAAPFSTYCTSKGAVRLLTKTLAAELGPSGIRVNAIHPGVVETSMTTDDVPIASGPEGESFVEQIPLGRLATPTDIAGAAVFLASDLSRYVNGESIVVDGGLLRI
ncbi:MAG: SDR family oxidoreductase [Ilumatobacter sp.]|uniref:SDR family oxidoreductase n=1 Tax=Ilumatobacter sp. TaxID=1967498 RepID=UPI00391A154C